MITIEQTKNALRQKDDPQSKCLLKALRSIEYYATLGGQFSVIGQDASNALHRIRQEWHNLTTK